MYTVFRINVANSLMSLSEVIEEFRKVDATLNISPHRKIQDLATFTICLEGEWRDHCEKMKTFLDGFSAILDEVSHKGVEMHFDIAVYKEDVKNTVYVSTCLDFDFLMRINNLRIYVAHTFYI